MKLSRLLGRLHRPVAPAAAAPSSRPLPYSRLSLDDWRASPERVSYVAELLRTPLFLDLLGMLANVRPVHRGALDPTSAATLLGQRIGHDQVIATLLAAGTLPPAPLADLPPADYDSANVQAQWEREGDMTERP